MATDPLSLDFGSDKPFYVYIYRDPRRGKKRQPIYVGKGVVKHGRAEGRHDHNPFLIKVLRKIEAAGLETIIEVVAWFDDEEEAFKLERALIARIGRRDQNRGPLTNLTDGGQGSVNIAESTREKLTAGLVARWQDPEYAAKMSAMSAANWQDMEWRERRLAQIRELAASPEYREKLRAAQALMAPEERQARSLRLTALRADPEIERRRKEATIAALQTEEFRQYKSAAHKEWWSNPENRERNMVALLEAHQRPEEKARKAATSAASYDQRRDAIIAGSKAAWADPEKRAARIAKIKAAHNRPESIAKRSAALKGKPWPAARRAAEDAAKARRNSNNAASGPSDTDK